MSFFFFEQKGTEAGGNAFPEVSGRPSAVFRDKFPGVLRMRRQGRTPVCPGSLGKTKVRTRDGSAKPLLFRRGGVRAAFGTKGGRTVRRTERHRPGRPCRRTAHTTDSSACSVVLSGRYLADFGRRRRAIGRANHPLFCRPTAQADAPARRVGGRVGFPGTKHSPPSDQVQAGGFRGGALFLPGAFCRQKSGRPCRRKADMMYLYTTLF